MEKEEKKIQNQDDFDALIDKLAKMVTERHLGVVAIVLLESIKPLSFLGSQVMVSLDPFVAAFFKPEEYRKFYRMIENRENVEKLIKKIEEYENEK